MKYPPLEVIKENINDFEESIKLKSPFKVQEFESGRENTDPEAQKERFKKSQTNFNEITEEKDENKNNYSDIEEKFSIGSDDHKDSNFVPDSKKSCFQFHIDKNSPYKNESWKNYDVSKLIIDSKFKALSEGIL